MIFIKSKNQFEFYKNARKKKQNYLPSDSLPPTLANLGSLYSFFLKLKFILQYNKWSTLYNYNIYYVIIILFLILLLCNYINPNYII